MMIAWDPPTEQKKHARGARMLFFSRKNELIVNHAHDLANKQMNHQVEKNEKKNAAGDKDGRYFIYEGSDSEPEEVPAEYFSSGGGGGDEDDAKDADGQVMPRCVSCGVALGYSNPRQYCRKTYCPEDGMMCDDDVVDAEEEKKEESEK